MAIFWMGLAYGAGVGAARGILGYLGNVQKEKFNPGKFFNTMIVMTLSGGLVGFMAQDIQSAIIASLASESVINAAKAAVAKKEET